MVPNLHVWVRRLSLSLPLSCIGKTFNKTYTAQSRTNAAETHFPEAVPFTFFFDDFGIISRTVCFRPTATPTRVNQPLPLSACPVPIFQFHPKEKMAEDADLAAIRAKRMAELQAQYGGGEGGVSVETTKEVA